MTIYSWITVMMPLSSLSQAYDFSLTDFNQLFSSFFFFNYGRGPQPIVPYYNELILNLSNGIV